MRNDQCGSQSAPPTTARLGTTTVHAVQQGLGCRAGRYDLDEKAPIFDWIDLIVNGEPPRAPAHSSFARPPSCSFKFFSVVRLRSLQ